MAGLPAIVIATEKHRVAFVERLAASGADVDSAIAAGQLQLYDARETLAKFMVDGRPDPDRFETVVGSVVRTATLRARVSAYGEMVDVLWRDGQTSAALELEELWNGLQSRCGF